MLKDIQTREVKDIAIAILPIAHNPEATEWDVFLINLQSEPITDILVSSRGYGELNGEKTQTSVLRHYFEKLDAVSSLKVELIQTAVFPLNNEYLLTFKQHDFLFDKRYVFPADSIKEENFTEIPLLNRPGILIE